MEPFIVRRDVAWTFWNHDSVNVLVNFWNDKPAEEFTTERRKVL